jgi:hypothetical protein
MSSASRVFELRTYRAAPGKFDALHARFRDHTCALFERHGFTMVGFWTPQDGQDVPAETLVYLLAFSDRSVADELWSAFRADPEWIKAKAESEQQGLLTTAIESVFLTATDYSPLS